MRTPDSPNPTPDLNYSVDVRESENYPIADARVGLSWMKQYARPAEEAKVLLTRRGFLRGMLVVLPALVIPEHFLRQLEAQPNAPLRHEDVLIMFEALCDHYEFNRRNVNGFTGVRNNINVEMMGPNAQNTPPLPGRGQGLPEWLQLHILMLLVDADPEIKELISSQWFFTVDDNTVLLGKGDPKYIVGEDGMARLAARGITNVRTGAIGISNDHAHTSSIGQRLADAPHIIENEKVEVTRYTVRPDAAGMEGVQGSVFTLNGWEEGSAYFGDDIEFDIKFETDEGALLWTGSEWVSPFDTTRVTQTMLLRVIKGKLPMFTPIDTTVNVFVFVKRRQLPES